MKRKNKKAALVGAGLIGAGFAVNALMNGWDVALRPGFEVEIKQTRARVDEGLRFFVEQGVLSEADKADALGRMVVTTDLKTTVEGAAFIQESVPERLELKRSVIAEIEEYAAPDTVIATSTSGLLVTDIFAGAKHPERGVGGHPYHPVYLIPLVEIVKGEKTADLFVRKAKEFYSEIGKEPVVLNKEMVGFIANRFQSCIHRELVNLVMHGVCSVEDADKALTYSVGLRWGLMGQALILHLGAAPEGLAGFTKKYNMKPGAVNKRMDDLAKWGVFPENWDQVLYEGVLEEIAHRAPETGTDMESIETWRDQMLVELLRLHGKLPRKETDGL